MPDLTLEQVLEAACVEFALDPDGEVDLPRFDDYGDAAIRAVALLAAKFRGMLRLAWGDIDDDFPDEVSEGDYEGYIADLNRRWEEHCK